MPKTRRLASPAQAEVRELAWLLYVTEGYRANVQHALAVNAYTLDVKSLALMERMLAEAESTCEKLRARIRKVGQ